jgi:CheY-like chemotaxis protein
MNRTVRVLVADDNEDHRFLIERALRNVNDGVELEVESVADGEEAIAYLERRGDYASRLRPHVMLLDLRMPRLGGLDVLDRVKRDPELHAIPVCVLTSSDRRDDIDEAYRRGTNSYVVKSNDMHDIREGLASVSSYWGAVAALPEPPA